MTPPSTIAPYLILTPDRRSAPSNSGKSAREVLNIVQNWTTGL